MAVAPAAAVALTVSATDATYDRINASSLDQPVLDAYLTRPAAGTDPLTWTNPAPADPADPLETLPPREEVVLLQCFIDTGASGNVVSFLHVTEAFGTPWFDLPAGDILGEYTELGIGGSEVGWVTVPFGVWLKPGARGETDPGDLTPDGFIPTGAFNLWVRQQEGAGEVTDILGFYQLVEPINILGMPVIQPRRMVMDFTPLAAEQTMRTEFLEAGQPEPGTHLTLPLVLRDFVGSTPPPGEVFPSHTQNPLVRNVSVSDGGVAVTGDWLFDTGAGSSFIPFATAQAIGIVPPEYATLADFVADFTGPLVPVGGIGGAALNAPMVEVDRIAIETREGATLVWRNVRVLIGDVAGLAGIFGMNLLVPSVNIDLTTAEDPFALLEALTDISPGAFTHAVFDATDPADPTLRLTLSDPPPSALAWLVATVPLPQRIDPVLGGLAGDLDGDGLPQIAEKLLGTSPFAANPACTVTSLPDGRPAFSFTIAPGNEDLAWSIQLASSPGGPWHATPDHVETVSTTLLPDGSTRHPVAPLTPAPTFARLHLPLP